MTDQNKSFEHEVKYKRNTSEKLNLEELGFKISKKKHQVDTYFLIDENINGVSTYLRVRNDLINNTASIDHHKVLDEFTTEENEVEISPNEIPNFINILEDSTRKKPYIVNKQRTIYKKDDINIMLDDVENLGSFIEIEVNTKEADFAEAIKMIQDVEQKLNLNPEDKQEDTSYPELLMEAQSQQ